MKNAALWEKLQSFSLDNPNAEYKLSDRLAKEQNWSKEFSLQAIEEYKKFMFLSVCAGHQVTPSKIIDEVWHLHLLYTRSYWDEMCDKILTQMIHHNPTEGGKREDDKYADLYQRTLNSYKEFFKQTPPIAIWGGQEKKKETIKNSPAAKVMACFSPLLLLVFMNSINPVVLTIGAIVLFLFIVALIMILTDRSIKKEREREKLYEELRKSHHKKSVSSLSYLPNRGKDKGMDKSNKKSGNADCSNSGNIIPFMGSCSANSDNSPSHHSDSGSSHSDAGSSCSGGSSCSSSSCGSSCGGGGCGGGD